MMIKSFLAAVAICGSMLFANISDAAQIGDSVSATLPVDQRVSLPQSFSPQEITHITLDSGVWEISGQVNFLSLHTPSGTMFTAGNISVGSASFEPYQQASVSAERIAVVGDLMRAIALVPRTIEVPNGTQVFLTAGSFNPNPNVFGWGFITAVKIRNHVQ
jgi:hypothetical protein